MSMVQANCEMCRKPPGITHEQVWVVGYRLPVCLSCAYRLLDDYLSARSRKVYYEPCCDEHHAFPCMPGCTYHVRRDGQVCEVPQGSVQCRLP